MRWRTSLEESSDCIPSDCSTIRTTSADKAIDEIGSEPNVAEVPSTHLEARHDVLVASHGAIGVYVEDRARGVKQSDHLVHALGHHQRVRVAGRLKHVGTLGRLPVVLEVTPASLEHITVNGRGMPMAIENPSLADTQQMHPVALRGHEAEGTCPHPIAERHPQAWILGQDIADNDLRSGIDGSRSAVGHPASIVIDNL